MRMGPDYDVEPGWTMFLSRAKEPSLQLNGKGKRRVLARTLPKNDSLQGILGNMNTHPLGVLYTLDPDLPNYSCSK